LIELCLDLGQWPFAFADRFADLFHFAHECGRIGAAFLELAEFSREPVLFTGYDAGRFSPAAVPVRVLKAA